MARSCDICGRLYNLEEVIACGNVPIRYSNNARFLHRDGAGRLYSEDLHMCPECAGKVHAYIRTMNSGIDKPEYVHSEQAT